MNDTGNTVTIYRLTSFGRIEKQENATPSASGKTWRSPRFSLSSNAQSGTKMHRRSDGWTDDRAQIIHAGLVFWDARCDRLRRQLEDAKGLAGNFRGELRKIEKARGEE